MQRGQFLKADECFPEQFVQSVLVHFSGSSGGRLQAGHSIAVATVFGVTQFLATLPSHRIRDVLIYFTFVPGHIYRRRKAIDQKRG